MSCWKASKGGGDRVGLGDIAILHGYFNRRHAFSLSRLIPPEFCSPHHALNRKGAGKAGCRLAPTVRCAHVAQKELHSGIQV